MILEISLLLKFRRMSEKFQLRWNDFSTNVVRSFSSLRNDTDFSDVTLVSDDQKKMPAHRIVLSTCSSYFKNMLKDRNQSLNVMLCLENVKSKELGDILDYIYNGEVKIFENELERFLAVAQRFQLDGLSGNISDESDVSPPPTLQENTLATEENWRQDEEDYKVEAFDVKDRKIVSQRQSRSRNKLIVGNLDSVEELDQKIIENLGKDDNGKPCCNICGQTGRFASHVREHIETHFEGLTFPCSQCPYVARYRNNLRKHISIHK